MVIVLEQGPIIPVVVCYKAGKKRTSFTYEKSALQFRKFFHSETCLTSSTLYEGWPSWQLYLVPNMHNKCQKFSAAKEPFYYAIDSVGQDFGKGTIGEIFVSFHGCIQILKAEG